MGKDLQTDREWLIETIFKDWDEYQAYYDKAAKFTNNGKRANGHLKKARRKYIEIQFKTALKAARYYYPDNSESIVLQVPSRGLNTKARGEKRMKLLDEHQHILGSTELYINDHIAMRMKVMGVKLSNRRTKR